MSYHQTCKSLITQQELKKILYYNPDTGIFTRKITLCPTAKKGDIAGSVMNDGYLLTMIKRKRYLNHRLAWLYMYGYFPENEIDHLNGIKNDNRISNLREVSHVCNMRNTGNWKHNTSGIKGVHWDEDRQKWRVQITDNKKKKYVGLHADFDEAVCTRLAAEQCLNWEGCDTCSTAYQYVQKILKIKKKEVLLSCICN